MTDLEERQSSSEPWFLAGNYAPVADELTAFDLPVTGAIPPSLSGRYLRNGSNPKSGTAGHWFFGDGMVHGIRLDGGKAEWYRNRYVQTTKLRTGLEATDPEAMFDPTASAANTHVLAHAGRIWALEEGHLPYELSPELDTLGCDNFDGKLTTAFTAHPKLCPETGELHFFGYSPVAPFLTYHVLDASGALVHSAEINVPAGTMMHDFMITRDHAIFMDLPVVFDLSNLQAPLKWDDNYGARIGIMPRMGTNADIRWFEVDPCYVFHPLNAYVEGDTVVCDVGRHASMWRKSMEDGEPCYMHRWTFDLATGAVGEQQLDGDSHAFPASTIESSGSSIATAGVWPLVVAAPVPSSTPAMSSSGTSRPASSRPTTSARTASPASSCSCRTTTRPARTRDGWSGSCTTRPTTVPTW